LWPQGGRPGERLAPADAIRILRLLADHLGEVVTRDRPRVSATLLET
jgi:type IV secretion system protein TrbB